MPKRPPAPPPDPREQELLEIARAQALLEGRDPDQAQSLVRAQIAHEAAVKARQEEGARLAASQRRARRVRIATRIGAVLAVGGVVAAAVPAVERLRHASDRSDALRSRLEELGKPAVDAGFRVERDWLDVPPEGVELEIPRDSCVALAAAREGSTGPAGLTVERGAPAAKIAAEGPVLWCSCDAEKATVKVTGAGQRGALRSLRVPAAAVGGAEVLRATPVASFHGALDGVPAACAEPAFIAWSASAGHGDLDPPGPARSGAASDLRADGFEPTGSLPTGRPFGVLRAKQGRCYLAVPEPGPAEIELRGPEGAVLVPTGPGPIAFCAHAADTTFTLRRPVAGPALHVVEAPASRAGGTMGLRAAALRHGHRQIRTALLPAELTHDARAALLGTGAPPSSIKDATAQALPGDAEDTLVAFALRAGQEMIPASGPPAPSACAPMLEPSLPLRTYLCAEGRPQGWRPAGDARDVGAAEGAPPFWLGLLGGVTDEGALRASAALLAFAQRLTLLGFEPTTTEGVKDTPEGAVVTGRTGKGETVAVGLMKASPWFVPLSDGPPWTLDGPLRFAKIPAGATATLRGAPRLPADPKARRVVVWRR